MNNYIFIDENFILRPQIMKENRPIAVITGPTSGIGEAFTYKLADDGYDLVLVARQKAKLKKLAVSVENKYGVTVRQILADLSLNNDIATVEKELALLQRIDLLINNAGFGVGGYFIEVPLAKQMDMLNVHLNSTIRFSRAVIPVMANQKVKGNIINVASFSVFIDVPGSVMYSTTKSAVVHFSKTLQYEVKDYNIKIQALCPVFTPTSFHKSINRDLEFMKNIPDFFWTPKEDVVLSSLKALNSSTVICIPGNFNRIIYWFNKQPLFSQIIHKITLKLNGRTKMPDLTNKVKNRAVDELVEVD